jgi:hypothetical protein
MIGTISAWLVHTRPKAGRVRWLLSLTAVLTGCSTRSAPALILFGAYFPDWLVFAILAIVVAIVARIAFGVAGLTQSVPFLLFTCLAVGILVAGAIDLIWLDR